MRRHATEGSGRYDHLHGDEPEIEAERREREQARGDYECDRGPRPCSICGETPCVNPSACRAQARFEDDPDAGDFVEMDKEMKS